MRREMLYRRETVTVRGEVTGARSTEVQYVPVETDYEAAVVEGLENGVDEVAVRAILTAFGVSGFPEQSTEENP